MDELGFDWSREGGALISNSSCSNEQLVFSENYYKKNSLNFVTQKYIEFFDLLRKLGLRFVKFRAFVFCIRTFLSFFWNNLDVWLLILKIVIFENTVVLSGFKPWRNLQLLSVVYLQQKIINNENKTLIGTRRQKSHFLSFVFFFFWIEFLLHFSKGRGTL